jgi:hypothetical protein
MMRSYAEAVKVIHSYGKRCEHMLGCGTFDTPTDVDFEACNVR